MSKNYFQERLDSTLSPMDYLNQVKNEPEKYYLVDVRNGPPHLRKEKIKGSLEIPQIELETRLAEFPKDKVIVLYCWDVWCNTASKAAIQLIDNGFEVRELAGGISAWKIMKLPLEPVADFIK